MGMASNLITDMTIKGATLPEIERAVKHSMVVIDAEKHNLDWKQSEIDNGIAGLRERYQDGGGASTLISKSKGEKRGIPERKEVYAKSLMTPEELERYNAGEIIYRDTGRTYKDKNGKIKQATMTMANMEYVKDARDLSAGYYIEELYASHANRLKALANEARKESRSTGRLEQNKTAKQTYAEEVKSLNEKLEKAGVPDNIRITLDEDFDPSSYIENVLSEDDYYVEHETFEQSNGFDEDNFKVLRATIKSTDMERNVRRYNVY